MASLLLSVRDDIQWPPAPIVGPAGPLGGGSATLLGCLWMEFVLASMLLGARLYTRYFISAWAGWALIWTLAAWLVGLVAQIILTVSLGRSAGGFSDDWMVSDGLMYLWVSIFLTFIAIGLSKFAIVAFILAMQGVTHFRERILLYFVAGSNRAIDLAFVFFMTFHCTNGRPYDMWVAGRDVGACQSNFAAARNFGYFTGAWNAFTDLGLALYPLFLLRTVQIAPNIKRGLIGVMSLGVISFVCAVVKTWDLRFVSSTAFFNVDTFCLTIWTYTEMWVVLITASIPPLWPLFKRARASFRASKASRSSRVWHGLSNGRSRSTSGYDNSRSRDEKLLVSSSPALPKSRSVAEGLTVTTISAIERETRAVTPAWGGRMGMGMAGLRSASRTGHREPSFDCPDSSPHSPSANPSEIMVTTELSVQHEPISALDEVEEELDADMRAMWVRRTARDAEQGRA